MAESKLGAALLEVCTPEKKTIEQARRDARQGKSPSAQAGEFVREEMDHIREGKHAARSAKQAIAIGLSKARRAGVDLKPPRKGQASKRTRSKRNEVAPRVGPIAAGQLREQDRVLRAGL